MWQPQQEKFLHMTICVYHIKIWPQVLTYDMKFFFFQNEKKFNNSKLVNIWYENLIIFAFFPGTSFPTFHVYQKSLTSDEIGTI